MTKIDIDPPTEVLVALAQACGFHITYDRTPGVDAWTLSHGHGVKHRQYVGTRASVCAFLCGYAAMMAQTTQILNELDQAGRKLILDMRHRFGADS